MTTILEAGDRVRYSRDWLEMLSPSRYERGRNRRGTIVGNPRHPRAKYIHVKWDDTGAYVEYAPHFIEADQESLGVGQ